MFKFFKRSIYKPTDITLTEILLLFCTIWMFCIFTLHIIFNYQPTPVTSFYLLKILGTPWLSSMLFLLSGSAVGIGSFAYFYRKTSEVTVFLFLQIVFWTLLCLASAWFDIFTPLVGFSGMFASTAYYLYTERTKFISSLNKIRED